MRQRRPKLTKAEKRQLARDWKRMAEESEATLRQKEEECGYLWADVPVDQKLDCTKKEPPF